MATVVLGASHPDRHDAVERVEVSSFEAEQLTASQSTEGGEQDEGPVLRLHLGGSAALGQGRQRSFVVRLDAGTFSSCTVNVANTAPDVELDATGDLDEGTRFELTGSFEDPDTDSWELTIDWGDGATPEVIPLTLPGTFSAPHTHLDDGTVEDTDPSNADPQEEENGQGATAHFVCAHTGPLRPSC